MISRIRAFEEKVQELLKEGKIYGTTHLSIGQEMISAAFALSCKKRDYLASSHRNHAHSLAKGSSMKAMFAELFGYKSGLVKGLGGSMHLFDKEVNNIGSSAVVASSVGIATGLALSSKIKEEDRVTWAFFGDGASNRGIIHESMNIASIYKLPIVFICENNLYAFSTPVESVNSAHNQNIYTRGQSYNIRSVLLNSSDPEEVYEVLKDAREYAKKIGPIFIEAKTYRFCGHSKLEPRSYRSKSEEQFYMDNDYDIYFEKEDVKKAKEMAIIEVEDAINSLKEEYLDEREALKYVYGELR